MNFPLRLSTTIRSIDNPDLDPVITQTGHNPACNLRRQLGLCRHRGESVVLYKHLWGTVGQGCDPTHNGKLVPCPLVLLQWQMHLIAGEKTEAEVERWPDQLKVCIQVRLGL